MRRALAAAALSLVGCSNALPPLPEVVVVADTDLPVSLAASRLRIDLYTEEGAWFASTDVARPDPGDWPVSFGVYSDDATRARRVWVRLRAYLDGRMRDYCGERPFTLGGPIDEDASATDAPRLLEGGRDATPPSEPDPLDAVDRLALVELVPDRKQQVRLVLHGACLGTSAVFGGDPATLVKGEAATCTDAEKTRAPVDVEAPEPDGTPLGASRQGSWLAEPACPPPDDASERVCVSGGATVIGATDPSSNVELPATPVRVLGLSRFFLDRHEVSVARFREALARGFAPSGMPKANDGPLTATPLGYCTWSTAPMGREDYSLNCIQWKPARDFCRFHGGDLPTEVQWEHAATIAGHGRKVRYPWGNDAPDCDRAAYGRLPLGGQPAECASHGALTPPPGDSAHDLTPLGINALGGGLQEWLLDEAEPYTDACWGDASIVDPRCGDPDASPPSRSFRGASFLSPMVPSATRWAQGQLGGFGPVGFRCAYPEAGP